MDLLETAYQKALEVLRQCATPLGFKASALAANAARDTSGGTPASRGYPQIWARDAPITSLGALVSGEPELVNAAKASLETLGAFQSELGMIPLNVDTRTHTITTENAGAVDANLWFVLGHYAYFRATGDTGFLRENWTRLRQAVLWLRYQDMNGCGLLEIPEAADWADLYAVRYNTLYDNALYHGALKVMSFLAGELKSSGTDYAALAEDVKYKINLLLWLDRPWDGKGFGEQLETLKKLRLEWFLLYQNTATLTERPYYLSWAGFREFGHNFDGFGNMLAILLGVSDLQKTERIFDYVHAVGANQPFPLKAFYPPIYPGERDWRDYYRSRNLNLPEQYHNGGIWPFLGGFYVAALAHKGKLEQAEEQLTLLAEASRLGRTREWEFNEWIHGRSGRAMGYPLQAWSAGMYVFAYRFLRGEGRGLLPLGG